MVADTDTTRTTMFDIETDATDGLTFLIARDEAPYGVLDALEANHVMAAEQPESGTRRPWARVTYDDSNRIIDVDRVEHA